MSPQEGICHFQPSCLGCSRRRWHCYLGNWGNNLRAEECSGVECYPNCNVDNPYQIGDGTCDGRSYNTEECGWDGGDCATNHHWGLCNWDGGDCTEFNQKYPDCHIDFPSFIGDGDCYIIEPYNTEECIWDSGDCTWWNINYPSCHVEFPGSFGDGLCINTDPCNSEECGWDGDATVPRGVTGMAVTVLSSLTHSDVSWLLCWYTPDTAQQSVAGMVETVVLSLINWIIPGA